MMMIIFSNNYPLALLDDLIFNNPQEEGFLLVVCIVSTIVKNNTVSSKTRGVFD
jgi:hypothetical protein